MRSQNDASRRIFLRYAITYLLILALPLLMAVVSFRISLGVIQRNIDATIAGQLDRSMAQIDRSLGDLQKMSIQISDDFQVNYYLAHPGPFPGVEFYNLKRISEKLSSYVLSNPLLGHCFLSLEKSGILVYESGFAAYAGFYGTLFSVDGFTAEQWHDRFLRAPDGELFLPRQMVRMGGQQSLCHLYRRSIGYGSYHLGSIVGIIDAAGLDQMLADLPLKYGGWAFVQDAGGVLIGSTNPDLGKVAAIRDRAAAAERLAWEGETYRLYHKISAANGWEYTATLGETRVFAEVRTFSTIIYLLLAVAAAAGVGASWLFASSNTRPLRRLFALVLGDQAVGQGRPASVYEQVEQAIVLLSDSNKRLEREAKAAGKIGATWFFQNLLRGSYRSREVFAKEMQVFHVELPPRARYVVLCRLAAFNAAREGESYPILREALSEAAGRHVGLGDFIAPVSFDDVAVIRNRDASRDYRDEAASFVEGVRSSIDPSFRGDFLFGIGTPTDDPFLLTLSYREAAAAVSSLAMEGREAFLFYQDMPKGAASYFYPLDLEENVMKAVRSANVDLLDSLLGAIARENLVVRRLPAIETRNLLVELRGTARRLLNELQQEHRALRAEMERLNAEEQVPVGMDGITGVFHDLLEVYGRGKRSHNTTLLASIQEYLDNNFARADLGLTVIADAFRISEHYLSSFYKEQTGEGLSAAIHRIRFDEASRLLLATDETIDAIALKCGYIDTRSFRRAFKQRYGLSPSAFKATRAARGDAARTR